MYYYSIGNQKGFTLVEVMIALVILSVGILAMAEMQIVAIKANARSKNITSAIILTEGKLEELKAAGFSDPSFSNGTISEGNIDETGASGGKFDRVTIIEDYDSSDDMKKVTVTISWTDSMGSSNITMENVLSIEVD